MAAVKLQMEMQMIVPNGKMREEKEEKTRKTWLIG